MRRRRWRAREGSRGDGGRTRETLAGRLTCPGEMSPCLLTTWYRLGVSLTHQLQRSLAARAPVVHGEGAVAERLRRDQLKPSRTGQPVLVQGRAVAGDPRVDEELVFVDQVQPIQLGREFAATEEHTGRGRVF